jgi:flagellar biosynthetic protein FliP
MSHFIRHYLEMDAAMFIGMGVLGMPAGMLVDGEALDLLVMFASMTIPMVAWMRYRGHSWRASGEMSGAMLVPTLVAIALLDTVDFDTLMVFEHVAMLLAMLGAMLLRPSEYTHRHGATMVA